MVVVCEFNSCRRKCDSLIKILSECIYRANLELELMSLLWQIDKLGTLDLREFLDCIRIEEDQSLIAVHNLDTRDLTLSNKLFNLAPITLNRLLCHIPEEGEAHNCEKYHRPQPHHIGAEVYYVVLFVLCLLLFCHNLTLLQTV